MNLNTNVAVLLNTVNPRCLKINGFEVKLLSEVAVTPTQPCFHHISGITVTGDLYCSELAAQESRKVYGIPRSREQANGGHEQYTLNLTKAHRILTDVFYWLVESVQIFLLTIGICRLVKMLKRANRPNRFLICSDKSNSAQRDKFLFDTICVNAVEMD